MKSLTLKGPLLIAGLLWRVHASADITLPDGSANVICMYSHTTGRPHPVSEPAG